jgi:hypothetical protein
MNKLQPESALADLNRVSGYDRSFLRRVNDVLRNKRKCCQNADLDRHLRLPARGDHEKAAEHRAVALHNSTDFECVRFRKMPLLQAFQSADYSNGGGDFCNQLSLWN